MPILETNVANQHIQIALDILALCSDQEITVSVGDARAGISKAYTFKGKKVDENVIDFGERFQREFWINMAKIKQLSLIHI